jgi:hypothetical protein
VETTVDNRVRFGSRPQKIDIWCQERSSLRSKFLAASILGHHVSVWHLPYTQCVGSFGLQIFDIDLFQPSCLDNMMDVFFLSIFVELCFLEYQCPSRQQ